MEKLVQDQDRIVAEHERFVHDGHIRLCSADRGVPEMDNYLLAQADRAIANDATQRDRAEGLKEQYHAKIEQVKQTIQKMNDVVQEMNTMMATNGEKTGWMHKLESNNVLALEDRMSRAKQNVETCENVLLHAMQATGIRNPEDAAKAIMMHHQALDLIADSAKRGQQLAQFMNSLNDLMTTYVNTNFNSPTAALKFAAHMRILPKGLGAIEDFHTEQQKRLDVPEERAKIIKGYVTRKQLESDPSEFMPAIAA